MLDTTKIIKSLNTKKGTEPDSFSAKFIKASANTMDSYIAKIISEEI